MCCTSMTSFSWTLLLLPLPCRLQLSMLQLRCCTSFAQGEQNWERCAAHLPADPGPCCSTLPSMFSNRIHPKSHPCCQYQYYKLLPHVTTPPSAFSAASQSLTKTCHPIEDASGGCRSALTKPAPPLPQSNEMATHRCPGSYL